MKVLGIIPARCGSKRVKSKNIKLLNGKPLIVYTIEAARKSKKLDRCIVSTDCQEIANISKKAGADVPFLRPPEFAEDVSHDKLYILHALDFFKKNENYIPDAIVILRPTTPFKTAKIIDAVIKLLEKSKADSVRTMTKTEGVFHPYWMYKQDEDNNAIPLFKEGIAEKYYQRCLSIPIYPSLNNYEQDYIINKILKIIMNYGN